VDLLLEVAHCGAIVFGKFCCQFGLEGGDALLDARQNLITSRTHPSRVILRVD
jgi:hypothetical protein